jgi:hypothetical protein
LALLIFKVMFYIHPSRGKKRQLESGCLLLENLPYKVSRLGRVTVAEKKDLLVVSFCGTS